MPILSQIDLSFLCCPYDDHGDLKQISEDKIACDSCGNQFQLIDGRPILINESRSLFSSDDIESCRDDRQFPQKKGWRYQVRRLFPAAAPRDIAPDLIAEYTHILPESPDVLVIGCGLTKSRYADIFPSGRLFLTDITLQGDAAIACDGECLPFRNVTLDVVVVDQVLEHAMHPGRIIGEIERCLKPAGIVYSGIPFYYPVHGFPYDFQRYTPLGHRLLYRNFRELEFNITQGPFSALSLSLMNFFSCLSKNLYWRRVISMSVRLVFKPILWLDKKYRHNRTLTIPAASSFLGQKQENSLNAKEIISQWSEEASANPR